MAASSGTAVPGLSTIVPSTSTSPARMIPCAFDRVGTNPRATNNLSRRSFFLAINQTAYESRCTQSSKISVKERVKGISGCQPV